jgi:excisionase family DNA binding protein
MVQNRKTGSDVTLLTPADAAKRIVASEMHVYRLVASGILRAVDIAQPGARRSKTRIRSDDLDAYIERQTRSVRPEPSPAA